MSFVDKSSAYPDTVQPGVPRLGKKPSGWTRAPMSKHLYEERRPIDLRDNTAYDLVTVKRARGGVVKRERKFGRDISTKTQFQVKAGDFLISKRQIVHGACSLVPKELDGSTVSNEYAVLRTYGTIDPNYLKYLSHSVYFQQTCFHSSIGVHVEKMIFKTDEWLEWQFDLPPLEEQIRIAEILRNWDEALATSQKLIDATQALQRGVAHALLDCPSSKSKAKKWRSMSLGQLGAFFSGVTYSPDDVTDANGLLVLRSSNVQDGAIAFDDNVYVKRSVRRSTLTQVGDIIICVRNGSRSLIGKTAQIDKRSVGLAHGAFMSLFRPQLPEFCRHLFNTPRFEKLVSQNLGATINSINTSDLRDFSFVLPPRDNWPEIGKILSTHEQAVELLKDRHRCIAKEKAALLQQLLSGKRRVSNCKVAA